MMNTEGQLTSISAARHQVDRRFTDASFWEFPAHKVVRVLEVPGEAVSWHGQKSGRRCLSCFLCRRFSHLTLHLCVFSSQVRHNAQHPFDEHQLSTAMHLMLFGTH